MQSPTTKDGTEYVLPLPLQPKTFPAFPTFPTEIRLHIWRNALPGSRTIHLKHANRLAESEEIKWSCSQRHPTLLAVDREARNEALRFYTVLCIPGTGFRLAFDPHRDTVYDPMCRVVDSELFEKSPFEVMAGGGDVEIRSFAVKESRIRQQIKLGLPWLQFDEIIIVVCVENSWDWPLGEDCVGMRTLVYSATNATENLERAGWGDIDVQNGLIRRLQRAWRRSGNDIPQGMNGLPVVKVVHAANLLYDDDSFCVGLTPLSLRRIKRKKQYR